MELIDLRCRWAEKRRSRAPGDPTVARKPACPRSNVPVPADLSARGARRVRRGHRDALL